MYGAENVLVNTYSSRVFQSKYAKELAAFKGYYPERYKKRLVRDTTPSQSGVDMYTLQDDRTAFDNTPEIICITYENGTSVIQTNF